MKKKLSKKPAPIKSSQKRHLAAITNHPSPIAKNREPLSNEEKIEIIADRFSDIMEVLGLDLSNDSLTKTPQRVAKMYVNEFFAGLDYDKFPEVSLMDNDGYSEEQSNMVIVRSGLLSFCEHHFVPMYGHAYIAYIPGKHLIGLSKIPRIVRYFARRPQLQERLTAQIADAMSMVLGIEDVAVTVSAKHFCVMARGVEDECGHTTTSAMRGKFRTDPMVQREFYEEINRKQ